MLESQTVHPAAAETNSSELLADLCASGSPLHEVHVPKGILALAEELVSQSDVVGIEPENLELLIRLVLYVGGSRALRGIDNCVRNCANPHFRPFVGLRVGVIGHDGSSRFWGWDEKKAQFVTLALAPQEARGALF